jgi:hypothetical protein
MTSKPAQRPIEERVQDRDWIRIEAELDAQGFAVIGGLLSQEQCVALAALYLSSPGPVWRACVPAAGDDPAVGARRRFFGR